MGVRKHRRATLSDMANIPFIVVRYAKNFAWFDVSAANQKAVVNGFAEIPQRMNEECWVKHLYRLCGYAMPDGLFRNGTLVMDDGRADHSQSSFAF